jgi:hypothetical protein
MTNAAASGESYVRDQSFVVARVLALRDHLSAMLTNKYTSIRLTADVFPDFVDRAFYAMPVGVDRDAVWSSLLNFLDTTPSAVALRAAAWRLAGNLQRLRAGSAALPWVKPAFAEWVPAQIVEMRPVRNRSHQPAFSISAKILAGGPAGMLTQTAWSQRAIYAQAKQFGFAKYANDSDPRKIGILRDPTELTTLRFDVLIEPKFCRDGQPGYQQFRVKSSSLRWNKAQLKLRLRLTVASKCPEGFNSSFPCFACHRGYATCRAGCHPRDYTKATCRRCGQVRNTDSNVAVGICVACFRAQQFAGSD